jgi:hypothetical protein
MVRFGPRYGQLLAEDARGVAHNWDNVVMDQESRVGGAVLRHMAQSGDTIYIWGYRPNLVVYSGLPIASQLWDSQPVTMVPADRHLGRTEVLNADWARQYQEQLVQTRPTFIVDGLSAYNPGLDIHKFPRLADWLKQYCESGQPGPGLTIYRRCER